MDKYSGIECKIVEGTEAKKRGKKQQKKNKKKEEKKVKKGDKS